MKLLLTALAAPSILLSVTASGQAAGTFMLLPENSPAGTSVGTPLQAAAAPRTVTYSISGPDIGLFDVNSSTG